VCQAAGAVVTAVERLIDVSAPVDRVWAALTDAATFARCYAEGGATLEPRQGGAVRLSWSDRGTFRGVVEETSPPSRFCYRLAVEPDREPTPTTSTLVEFRLAPAQLGTRVIVRESGFGSLDADALEAGALDPVQLMERAGEAWTSGLERLAREFDAD
jgi:uncharacterized protein YndB with AHSA1/START domain